MDQDFEWQYAQWSAQTQNFFDVAKDKLNETMAKTVEEYWASKPYNYNSYGVASSYDYATLYGEEAYPSLINSPLANCTCPQCKEYQLASSDVFYPPKWANGPSLPITEEMVGHPNYAPSNVPADAAVYPSVGSYPNIYLSKLRQMARDDVEFYPVIGGDLAMLHKRVQYHVNSKLPIYMVIATRETSRTMRAFIAKFDAGNTPALYK